MSIDFSLLSSIVTVLALAAFVAIIGWTIAPRNKHRFDAASQLPFELPDERAAGSEHNATRART